MKETRISFSGNTEGWRLQSEYKTKGYKKVADAYWSIIFEKDDERIILERD